MTAVALRNSGGTAAGTASGAYFDRQFDRSAVKILPGEYHVATNDIVLVTVLGSCVSACVRDSRLGIGGMNHFMLPEGGDGSGTTSASARYGAYAMEVLVNELIKLGASRDRLEAKVFGGGNVMAGLTQANVGERNSAFVLRFLRGTGRFEGRARVRRELAQRVEFGRVNLMDREWAVKGPIDAIFCRNVMLYFDKPTQARLIERFAALLAPHGLFFAGHAESLLDNGRYFRLKGQTVYELSKGAAGTLSPTLSQGRGRPS
jgi:chemotaxis receptor (MCP) glutamine deamidase CheD